MKPEENLKIALRSLKRNKGRTWLTMLGIVIGISSFILVNSVGAGAQSLILEQINKLGTNLIGILPGAADKSGPPVSVFGVNITTLKKEDAEAIEKNVPNIVAVAAYVRGAETASFGGEKKATTFFGVSPSYLKVQNTELDYGRFYSEQDEDSSSRVVVLGSKLKEDLFKDENPIGKEITLSAGKFRVIGVMKERGTTVFQDFDNVFFMPLSTAQKVVLGIRYLNLIHAKVNDAKNIDKAREDIVGLLRQRHRITSPENDDFDVRGTDQALGALTAVTGALKLFLVVIAAISLVVGGVGIMNIMYVAVSERTYEIGLRKAVGAKNKDILLQFLAEAFVVTLIAGVSGIFIGLFFSWLVAVGAKLLGFNWQFVVSGSSVFLAIFISALIGIGFGIYPARRAAKKSPVESLGAQI